VVGYFERHEEPGYSADITRHFAEHDVLLDVGCGNAWLGDHFANYTGVDASTEAVERARGNGRNVVMVQPDGALPFPGEQFSAVVVKDVLEHVSEPVALVHELRRVMRPGARLYACTPDAQRWVWEDYTHVRPFPLRALRQMFTDNGFAIVDSGYESVVPGSSIVSGMTRRHRRPLALRVLGVVPVFRRNCWVLVEKRTVAPGGAPAPVAG
jgi:SAM-dependent methyltransferase